MGANAFGQSVLRREDQRLLTGTGAFTADLIPVRAARAVMLRSPHAHARIVAIDTSMAAAMPGVRAIITGADAVAEGLGGIPAGSDLLKFPGTPADQDFLFRPVHALLATDFVRFVGDSVAMVVADSEAEAQDAMVVATTRTVDRRLLRAALRPSFRSFSSMLITARSCAEQASASSAFSSALALPFSGGRLYGRMRVARRRLGPTRMKPV